MRASIYRLETGKKEKKTPQYIIEQSLSASLAIVSFPLGNFAEGVPLTILLSHAVLAGLTCPHILAIVPLCLTSARAELAIVGPHYYSSALPDSSPPAPPPPLTLPPSSPIGTSSILVVSPLPPNLVVYRRTPPTTSGHLVNGCWFGEDVGLERLFEEDVGFHHFFASHFCLT